MRIIKNISIIPLYLIYFIWFEIILGFGMKDIWDDLKKWANK